MLQSLSQVGTNCHKVQNVLVSWGVCSLLTMPQPPWGGGSSRRAGAVWGLAFSCSRTHARKGTHTLHSASTQLRKRCHVRRQTCFENPGVRGVGGVTAKRKGSGWCRQTRVLVPASLLVRRARSLRRPEGFLPLGPALGVNNHLLPGDDLTGENHACRHVNIYEHHSFHKNVLSACPMPGTRRCRAGAYAKQKIKQTISPLQS